MLRKVNQASGSKDGFQNRPNIQATCLLCRILWPTRLPHRHLASDFPSEAQTIIRISRLK